MEPGDVCPAKLCPDCSSAPARAISPAALCPRCMLRLGASLAVDLDAGPGNPDDDGADEDPSTSTGPVLPPTRFLNPDDAFETIPRIHLRDAPENTRLILPKSPRDPQACGPVVALPTDRRTRRGAGWARSSRDATSTSAGISPSK